MASKYTNEHAGALADLTAAGAEVTFTRTVQGTIDDSTDTETGGSTSTITGSAVEVAGDRDTYRALGLTHMTGVTLFFSPDEIGDAPQAGDTVEWAGATITVKAREALAPDGVPIAATVWCQR